MIKSHPKMLQPWNCNGKIVANARTLHEFWSSSSSSHPVRGRDKLGLITGPIPVRAHHDWQCMRQPPSYEFQERIKNNHTVRAKMPLGGSEQAMYNSSKHSTTSASKLGRDQPNGLRSLYPSTVELPPPRPCPSRNMTWRLQP